MTIYFVIFVNYAGKLLSVDGRYIDGSWVLTDSLLLIRFLLYSLGKFSITSEWSLYHENCKWLLAGSGCACVQKWDTQDAATDWPMWLNYRRQFGQSARSRPCEGRCPLLVDNASQTVVCMAMSWCAAAYMAHLPLAVDYSSDVIRPGQSLIKPWLNRPRNPLS